MGGTIKVVKRAANDFCDYSVYVIFNPTKAIEIQVDLGLNANHTTLGINIPATGNLSRSQAVQLAKGISIATDLLTGELSTGAEGYAFTPTRR